MSRLSIPKNSTCLTRDDYLAYLLSNDRTDPRVGIRTVWQERLPSRHLYPTPTGRHALWYFLELSELSPGEEVLVAAYNFYVIIRLILQKGLKPVFVDVEAATLCMDPSDLERKITPRARLVIVTHMFGHCADLTSISEICSRKALMLFEDCAHAVGTLHRGRQVGQCGAASLFSFGVEKIVNSFGGGMMALAEPLPPDHEFASASTSRLPAALDTLARFAATLHSTPSIFWWVAGPARFLLRQASRFPRLAHYLQPSRDDPDYRFKADSRRPLTPFMVRMQALQLRRLDANIARRRALIDGMTARLPAAAGVRALDADRHGRSNGAYFCIAVPDPLRLAEYLAKHGIASGPREFLDCSSLRQFEDHETACPAAREASRTILRLPNHPCLSEREAAHISAVIGRFFGMPAAEGMRPCVT